MFGSIIGGLALGLTIIILVFVISYITEEIINYYNYKNMFNRKIIERLNYAINLGNDNIRDLMNMQEELQERQNAIADFLKAEFVIEKSVEERKIDVGELVDVSYTEDKIVYKTILKKK